MSPLVWLVLWLVAAAVLLALGGIGAWPVAYRRGYAAAEAGERHRHRHGDPQETVLLELPKAGRLPVLADLAEAGAFGPPIAEWVFAGGWDEGPVSGPAEYELLTRIPEPGVVDEARRLLGDARSTTTGEIQAITDWVDGQIAAWEGDTNYWLHTHRADT
jgi:hypothetical protein